MIFITLIKYSVPFILLFFGAILLMNALPADADGHLLIFNGWVGNNLELFVADASSGKTMNLTRSPSWDSGGSWSSDGSQFAFISDRDADHNIYVIDFEHRQIRREVALPDNQSDPMWSPDGRWLMFISNEAGIQKLYAQDMTTSAMQWLSGASIFSVAIPQWSPDSQQVVFMGQTDENYDMYLVDVATGALDNLKQQIATDWLPVWSPDGRWLAFQSDRGNMYLENDIFLYDTVSNDVRNLTQHRGSDDAPVWSPDGRYIALSSGRSGSNVRSYVLEVDSGQVVELSDLTSAGSLVWSQDGASILFETMSSGFTGELWMYNLSDQTQRRITPDTFDARYPTWSPHEDFITFEVHYGIFIDIYYAAYDDLQFRLLTTAPDNGYDVRWQPVKR